MTAPAQSGNAADDHAIRALVHGWMEASSAGDIDALLDMMTSDVIFVTVGRPPMSRDEFARSFGAMDRTNVELKGSVETQEIVVDGDVATMSNIVTVTIKERGGPRPTTRSGRTLTVLRRGDDGRWRIWRDANLMAH